MVSKEPVSQLASRHLLVMRAPALAKRTWAILSVGAHYFKTYRPFMQPVTRIKSIADGLVRLATERFRLELELGQWIAHLDELGFAKEPVEHTKLKPPFDFAQAMRQ